VVIAVVSGFATASRISGFWGVAFRRLNFYVPRRPSLVTAWRRPA
jgi:hypothetical protein